jgi:two-component system response regulator YesN
MLKLLLVDDEPLEREGLEMMINRELPGVWQCIHAENGRRAIELAEIHQPDVIFMDIRMPGVSGLEALKFIKQKCPDARMVLVTAYEQFEYAREAIRMGVKEYLLKPARKEQVLSLLQRLQEELSEERQRRDSEQQMKQKLTNFIQLAESEIAYALIFDPLQEERGKELFAYLDLPVAGGYALTLSFPATQGESMSFLNEKRKRMYHSIKNFVKTMHQAVVSPFVGNHVSCFVLEPNLSYSDYRSQSTYLARVLLNRLKTDFNVTVNVGIGRQATSYEELRRSYLESFAASQGNVSGRIRYYEAMGAQDKEAILPVEDIRPLVDALLQGEQQKAVDILLDVWHRLGFDEILHAENGLRFFIELFAILQWHLFEMGIVIEQPPVFSQTMTSEQWLMIACREIHAWCRLIQLKKGEKQTDCIARMKEYLAESYMKDLTLEQAAEYVNLSPYYFSKLFKQHTGETFIDYLTRLRIEKAKELIRNPEKSLKEICYLVGYRNPAYFSRVFKKWVGQTPSEYRARFE